MKSPRHLLHEKFKKVAGPVLFFGYMSVRIPTPVKPNISVQNVLQGRVLKHPGEFLHAMKRKIRPRISSVARADPVSGQRQEHFGERLQKS